MEIEQQPDVLRLSIDPTLLQGTTSGFIVVRIVARFGYWASLDEVLSD